MMGIVVAAVAVAVVLLGIVLAWVVTAVAELREAKATTTDLDLVIDHINQISRDVYSEQDRIALAVDRARDDASDAKSAQTEVGSDVQDVRARVASIEGDVNMISNNYASNTSLNQLTSDVSEIMSEVTKVSGAIPDGGGVKIEATSETDYLLLKADGNGGAQLCSYSNDNPAGNCKAITTANTI